MDDYTEERSVFNLGGDKDDFKRLNTIILDSVSWS